MSADSNAYSHLDAFRWRQGDHSISREAQELHDAVTLAQQAAELLADRAVAAHDTGMTWAEIAEIAGITRQAASARWSRR